MKTKNAILIGILLIPLSIFPCSAVTKTVEDVTLFGGNMDWMNPYSQVKVEPGINGNNGVIYLGYGDREMIAFSGGVNDKGLALDFFSTPPNKVKRSIFRKDYNGRIYKKILRECSNVDEAIKLVKKYEREYLYNGQMILVDKSGKSVIVEGNNIVEKKGNYQIVTNFNLSTVKNNKFPCKRYNDALGMIDEVEFSVDGFEDILNKVKQNKFSKFPTIYSYIIDFSTNELHLYNFGNFEDNFTINIGDAVKNGEVIIDIPNMAPNEDYSNYLTKYKNEKPKEIEIKNLSDFVGYYEFFGTKYKIYIENESLYFDDNGVKYKMIPHRKDRFHFDYLDLLIEFKRDKKNNVDVFTTYHKGWGINSGKKL